MQHSEAREDDQQWKTDLHSQLDGFIQVIDGLSTSVAEVHHVALRTATQQPTIQTEPNRQRPISLGQRLTERHLKNQIAGNATRECADEVNVDLQRAVADPFSLETSNDSLVQHEFNYAGDAIDADSSALTRQYRLDLMRRMISMSYSSSSCHKAAALLTSPSMIVN